MTTNCSISVAARVRPIAAKPAQIRVDRYLKKIHLRAGESDELLEYEFDQVFDQESSQEQVYEECVLPVLEAVMNGINGCIFAYGATGAGKSFTMHGPPSDPGIIPRTAQHLFDQISTDHGVYMSATEIYNGQLYDLLGPKKRVPLKILESLHGVHVCDLAEHQVQNYEKFKVRYDLALSSRSLSSTQLNAESSRSHLIISFRIVERRPGKSLHRTTQLNLIDLAGNEDNRKTGNTGERMTESSSINLSLFALVKVIDALRTGQSRVPYRESKLTRLLQNSLAGNCRTAMVCCINPRTDMAQETQYTLNYAAKARGIEATVQAGQFVADHERDSSGSSQLSISENVPSNGRSYMTGTQSSKARNPRGSNIHRPTSLKRVRTEPTGSKEVDNARALELLQQARKLEAVGAIVDALRVYKDARRYLGANEKLEKRIEKLERRVDEQTQAATTEEDIMMKKLQETEVSDADMIHYMLSWSAKKRRVQEPEMAAEEPAPTEEEYYHEEDSGTDYDDENADPNYTEQTPSKAELKKTLNTRIVHALNVQLMDLLNEGTLKEVRRLYGIGPKRAEKIIEARERVRFETVEDLQNAGISMKVARTMRQAFMAELEEA